MSWEPNIIAFCCNWCSYAGADLAGVSRFQYPPNVRVIRVMCSGRVEPSFVLEALKMGADGVLVTGCHIGDCHYISGNEKAKTRMEGLGHILDILGIEKGRVGLEWISASEGQRFATVITDFVTQIRDLGPNPYVKGDNPGNPGSVIEAQEAPEVVQDKGTPGSIEYCIECNKCAASCPITRANIDYSPSKNVFSVSIDPAPEAALLPDVWECLTCGICSQRCPSGVRYEELIRDKRALARDKGEHFRCAHGETLGLVTDLQTLKDLKQNRKAWLPKDLKVADKGDILYFIGCQPFFEHALFTEAPERSEMLNIGTDASETVGATISLLNKAGITPVVLDNERCCGHDPYWTGDDNKFRRLAELNIKMIRESGAKLVLFSCAEGYRTFKLDYPKYFGDLGFEVMHTTEYFATLLDEGKIVPNGSMTMTVGFQDPCRLSRHTGVIDPPRKVLGAIPDLKVVELGLGGRDTTCCGGPNGWINCGQRNRSIQFGKFREAIDSEIGTIVTACPKCLIHLKCAMNSRLPADIADHDIELIDINTILDRATGGGDKE